MFITVYIISETTNISRREYGKLGFSETLVRDAMELQSAIAHYIILIVNRTGDSPQGYRES